MSHRTLYNCYKVKNMQLQYMDIKEDWSKYFCFVNQVSSIYGSPYYAYKFTFLVPPNGINWIDVIWNIGYVLYEKGYITKTVRKYV